MNIIDAVNNFRMCQDRLYNQLWDTIADKEYSAYTNSFINVYLYGCNPSKNTELNFNTSRKFSCICCLKSISKK